MYEDLKKSIKYHEGFRDHVYLDSLGKKTIGYGHLCRSDESWDMDKANDIEVLEECFEKDFQVAVNGAETLIGKINMNNTAKEVIIEMVFQLGKTGVKKFKKMWAAFKKGDTKEAAKQMLDSKWADQTSQRAEHLASIIRSI